MNEIVLQDKQIQKIDLALEKIMKNDSRSSDKKSKSKSEAVNEDKDEYEYDYEDNYDGNEWDDYQEECKKKEKKSYFKYVLTKDLLHQILVCVLELNYW